MFNVHILCAFVYIYVHMYAHADTRGRQLLTLGIFHFLFQGRVSHGTLSALLYFS